MSEINKHYTFQEYLENFSSIQDSYEYYFELQKEIDRLYNIIKVKTDFIEELLKIIAVARDFELHDNCYTIAKIYEEKIHKLKGDSNE